MLIYLMQYIWQSTASIKLHNEIDHFVLEKGVTQANTISPKLFIAYIEEIFKKPGVSK
jgi:hypothetical protein